MFVIETILPDGPHWYSGVTERQKDGKIMKGPMWSPYWEDRVEMTNFEAGICLSAVCKDIDGAKMIPVSEAKYKDGWKHLGGDEVMIRAKYLQKGMKILRTGVFYIVSSVTDKEIITYPEGCFNPTGSPRGASQKIGKQSNEWITVIYKPVQQATS